MINNYYKQKQIIARVDKKGNVIGKIEKWEAHKRGILHKALTIALIYKNNYIVQHRKHPAFDGVFDITSSSHQLYINNKLQETLEATYLCLKREWNLEKDDLLFQPRNEGTVYYKARDKKSIYTEHEVCEILVTEVKKLPLPNFDFAHGYSLIKKEDLKNKKGRIYHNLAPWVKVMIAKNLL